MYKLKYFYRNENLPLAISSYDYNKLDYSDKQKYELNYSSTYNSSQSSSDSPSSFDNSSFDNSSSSSSDFSFGGGDFGGGGSGDSW